MAVDRTVAAAEAMPVAEVVGTPRAAAVGTPREVAEFKAVVERTHQRLLQAAMQSLASVRRCLSLPLVRHALERPVLGSAAAPGKRLLVCPRLQVPHTPVSRRALGKLRPARVQG
ncbi:MAG: hypothetical protein WBC04_13200 [Candidatus Acidiferrales bacterium]